MTSLRSPTAQSGKRRLTELEQAREETLRARADFAAAQERADHARAKLQKATRDSKVKLRVAAVVMMTAAVVKVGWEAAMVQPPTPKSKIVQPMTPASGAMPVRDSERHVQQTEADLALDRLREAFHSFPDEDQPAVVREVNARYAESEITCPLAWTEGVPALSVKDGGKTEPMMAGALNRCAAGVERLRKERDADNASFTK